MAGVEADEGSTTAVEARTRVVGALVFVLVKPAVKHTVTPQLCGQAVTIARALKVSAHRARSIAGAVFICLVNQNAFSADLYNRSGREGIAVLEGKRAPCFVHAVATLLPAVALNRFTGESIVTFHTLKEETKQILRAIDTFNDYTDQ